MRHYCDYFHEIEVYIIEKKTPVHDFLLVYFVCLGSMHTIRHKLSNRWYSTELRHCRNPIEGYMLMSRSYRLHPHKSMSYRNHR